MPGPNLDLYFTDSENLCQYLKGSYSLDDEGRPVDWNGRDAQFCSRSHTPLGNPFEQTALLDLNNAFSSARPDLLNPLRNLSGEVEQRFGVG